MKPRIYVRKGIWHLCKGKNQGRIHRTILGTIAKPLPTTETGALAPSILNFAVKKILGRGKREKKHDKGEDEDLPRNKILPRKLPQPKLIRLPNG